MPWVTIDDPSGSFDQASDPVNDNDWEGACDQTDLTVDTEPPQLPDNTLEDDVIFLEGWEMDDDYVDGTTVGSWTRQMFGGTPFSISTNIRNAGVTAQNSLKCVCDSSNGGFLRSNYKVTGRTAQYLRVYVQVESFTNTNGSARYVNFMGWTDATGHRSHVAFLFPATLASTPRFAIGQNVLTGGVFVDGTTPLVLGTWYRIELITERITTGQTSTAKIYLGDTSTLFETLTVTTGGNALGGFAFAGCDATHSGNAITSYQDDIRCETSTPTVPAAAIVAPLYGAGGVFPIYPFAASLSAWTPLSSTNFSNVDEFPLVFDDDTTYISSTGTAQLRDTYVIRPYDTVPTGLVKAVDIRTRTKNVSGTSANLRAIYVDFDATVNLGPQTTASTGSYTQYPREGSVPHLYLIYPNGVSTVLVNNQKIGIQRDASGPTSEARATAIWGYMDIQ
jgi:hypothetical protein